MLISPAGTLQDKLALRSLRDDLLTKTEDEILSARNESTEDFLRSRSFSTRIVDRFFRPLAGGILLDQALRPSSRMFQFVFKMMSEGDTAVPAKGMGEIPKQLAARLPVDSIRLSSKVAGAGPNHVTLDSGEEIRGAAVVVACDGGEAARLAPQLPPVEWRSVVCSYFEAPEPPVAGPWLVLNGNGDWPVNNLATMSEVSRDYSASGKALVSVSTVGPIVHSDGELQAALAAQLERWFGKIVREWRPLKTYKIARAQPDTLPGPPTERPAKLRNGLFAAGDHRQMPSINYALWSGRHAAEAVASELTGRK
jgi:phytoene dehydrogenase-like protein